MQAFQDMSRLSREPFGHLPDGTAVERITLRGEAGFSVSIMTLGAAIQALYAPDRAGGCADVVLGHDTLEPYLARRDFFGATVGRYANRIANAAFTLDGACHTLCANDGANTLHGGAEGFDRVLWAIESLGESPTPFVTLTRTSPDREAGFPGELIARVTYSISGPQQVTIAYEATTDRPTVVNLTHHGYFNLAGTASGEDILGHELTLQAERFLPVDSGLIPVGAPADVAGTPFDFRGPRLIGTSIRMDDPQLRLARGYDHCFVTHDAEVSAPRPVARVVHRASGRALDLATDQPGIQFYSGNFLDGSIPGKGGRLYRQSDAFCLEPQRWPAAPNRPDFPSARLDPGQTYRHVSVFSFHTM